MAFLGGSTISISMSSSGKYRTRRVGAVELGELEFELWAARGLVIELERTE